MIRPPSRRTAILITLFSAVSGGAATGAEESTDQDECLFDQAEQRRAYLELEQTYPESEYLEEQHKLLIPRGNDLITLRRGGCVHFGISVELRTARTQRFDDEGAFFAQVMALVTEFGQEFIDPNRLEQSIRNRNWSKAVHDDSVFFFVSHPDVAAFEMHRKSELQFTTVGVSFYY